MRMSNDVSDTLMNPVSEVCKKQKLVVFVGPRAEENNESNGDDGV